MKRVIREIAVYKGYSICKYGNKYCIYDDRGELLKVCNTKQACMNVIDEEFV